ncbi:biopolymer transporter ExbD [bacterium]|mgnify:CR=1 FL=1|nr:biopolymer transporter ExbD [bacterium]
MKVDLRDDEGLEVQMAPLIDCVFLLLIFFLVATTLKKINEELPLVLPESKAAIQVQEPDQFIVIAIDENQNIYVDGTPVSIGLLQNDLRARSQATPEMKVRLDVDHAVPFQRVMQLLDILQFEGLKNVGINTHQERFEPLR